MKINCGDNNNEFKLSCDSSIRGDAWEGRKGRERESCDLKENSKKPKRRVVVACAAAADAFACMKSFIFYEIML